MRTTKVHAPPALLILGGHLPTPARVELVYRPALRRGIAALLSLICCWGLIPYLIWIPPHYPWALAALIAGIYLPYYFWAGKYMIRSFLGWCPRCGRALTLKAGMKISLPHTLTCFSCHFESLLEVPSGPPSASCGEGGHSRVEHRDAECVGEWSVQWFMDQPWAVCRRCGARGYATPEVRRIVEEENERGRMLEQLTIDGRFLL